MKTEHGIQNNPQSLKCTCPDRLKFGLKGEYEVQSLKNTNNQIQRTEKLDDFDFKIITK